MNFIDLLPKMDASAATVSRDFLCPECSMSGIDTPSKDKPKLVGWCETDYGYMMIAECPHCFEKFRFHGTVCDKHDSVEFEHAIRCYILSRYFSNSEELEQKRKEGKP